MEREAVRTRASQDQDHDEAVTLLARVNSSASKRLKTLLASKSTSQYGTSFFTRNRAQTLLTHAQRLCEEVDKLLQT
jgi:hypothetical protein